MAGKPRTTILAIDQDYRKGCMVTICGERLTGYRIVKTSVKDFSDYEKADWVSQEYEIASRALVFDIVIIEAPVFSWSRRNPRVYARQIMLATHLEKRFRSLGSRVIFVNNRSAKAVAKIGRLKSKAGKAAMVKAFLKKEPGFDVHIPKYQLETIADAYFLAMAYKVRNDPRLRGKP